MLSFNYLSEPLDSVASWRIPQNLQAPARMIACCFLFAVAALTMEGMRLRAALMEASKLSEQYSAQTIAFRAATADARRVSAVAALDQDVRRIAASGTKAALKIGAITRSLPPDVWLTALSPAGNGFDIEGGAANLDGVRRTLTSLNADGEVGETRLVRTDVSSTGPRVVRFSMHLGGDAP